MSTIIRRQEMTKLLNLIASELEKNLPEGEIRIKTDPYWYIPTSEWSVMNKDLTPALGMLSEDWEYLQKFLNKEDPFSFLVLDKVAVILQAISETIIPTK
jgi:hypothetical protein